MTPDLVERRLTAILFTEGFDTPVLKEAKALLEQRST